jgi:hypothetical protein
MYNSNPSLENTYIETVKREKKANITKENIYELMLCQIPSVSSKVASAIMSHFDGDFEALLDCLKTNPSQLNEIKVNNRKIGKNIIEKMCELLIQEKNVNGNTREIDIVKEIKETNVINDINDIHVDDNNIIPFRDNGDANIHNDVNDIDGNNEKEKDDVNNKRNEQNK